MPLTARLASSRRVIAGFTAHIKCRALPERRYFLNEPYGVG